MSASFNEQLRRAFGVTPASLGQPVMHAGDIGIGRGGLLRPSPRVSTDNEISAKIRRAALVVRGRVSPEDIWP